MDFSNVQALVFDTYGTVVDWRGTMIAEGEALNIIKSLNVDWAAFAAEWKSHYRPAMDAVNADERPWTKVEAIYREKLEDMLPVYGLETLSAAEIDHLNRVWSRSLPWPDSHAGLKRMKSKFVLSTLSNGDFIWLAQMAKLGDLPWDCILCAENAKRYKPAPEIYEMAIELLGPAPDQVMLVACHNYDLKAARGHGMRTAFVPRSYEFGAGQKTDLNAEEDWDIVAENLEDLATRLEC